MTFDKNFNMWQRPICFYAQPTAPRQTLNDRLPFENSSHRVPQTSNFGKTRFRRCPTFHVSTPEKFSVWIFSRFSEGFFRFFILFWRVTHFWTFLASSPWKTTSCRPIINSVRLQKWYFLNFAVVLPLWPIPFMDTNGPPPYVCTLLARHLVNLSNSDLCKLEQAQTHGFRL